MTPRWHNVNSGWYQSDPQNRGVFRPRWFRVTFARPILTLQISEQEYLQPPEAFDSDASLSIPRPLQLLPGFDRTAHPFSALFHDGCYRRGVLFSSRYLDGPWEMLPCPRRLADDLFRLGLIAEGASRFKARAMWLGVRGGGWIGYDPRLPAAEQQRRYLDAISDDGDI